MLNERKATRTSPVRPQSSRETANSPSSPTALANSQALLAQHLIPTTFTREHDLILLAEPFALQDQIWTSAHTERIIETTARHFLHSAAIYCNEDLSLALQASSTEALTYRMTSQPSSQANAPVAILLTCAPKAHLALGNFLERGALFAVETIGRVTAHRKL